MPVVQGRKVLFEVVIAESLGKSIDTSFTAIVGLVGSLVGVVDEGVPVSMMLAGEKRSGIRFNRPL